MTACWRLLRVEVPDWPRLFPLYGLRASRYRREDTVPPSPRGSGIAPDVGQQVVTPFAECFPSPAHRQFRKNESHPPAVPAPYSPELQPAEHLWPLTNAALVNQHFASIEELEDAQAERCVALQGRPISSARRRASPGGRSAFIGATVRGDREVCYVVASFRGRIAARSRGRLAATWDDKRQQNGATRYHWQMNSEVKPVPILGVN